MKKILLFVLALASFLFTGCNKEVNINSIDGVLEYINTLDTYTYSALMKVNRNSKVANINLDVIYKKPNYCVSYSNEKLDKQYIVKNSNGVFVLTPKADKSFEFNSDWPLNSSHCYMLSSLAKDILEDKDSKITIEGTTACIEAKASSKTNSSVKCLVFEFDLAKKCPLKSYFKSETNENIIEVVFSNFKANPSVSDDSFNTDLIMNQNQNETTSVVDDSQSTINASYCLENAILSSKKQNEDYQILCYTCNDKNYQIVARELRSVKFNGLYSFDDFDLSANGLVLYDETRVYTIYNNLEVSVYSTTLTKDEMYQVICGIELV